MTGVRRLFAVVRQRCPNCLEGQVFRSTFRVLPACQLCGHRLESRRGSYRATYASGAAVAVLLCVVVAAAAWHWLAPAYGRALAGLTAAFCWLLLLPAVFRYARLIRAHLEVSALDRALR